MSLDEADSLLEVWDCNWPAVIAFDALSTQWRSGFDGPTGLDYSAIPTTLRLLGMKSSPALFEDIRTMEDAALRYFAFMRKKNGRP
ncbi:DUF1799 domain-containing protein [Methylibium sp.]|uniref:DUF1799 domain-containing protein n=1 Tax=Methylibium sp. TaxID=2067992 RepID=UPI0025EE2B1B|nr:DUF1799 domain-containing protein [Methylibium sp.]